jgi:hypothetical protein
MNICFLRVFRICLSNVFSRKKEEESESKLKKGEVKKEK